MINIQKTTRSFIKGVDTFVEIQETKSTVTLSISYKNKKGVKEKGKKNHIQKRTYLGRNSSSSTNPGSDKELK